MQTQEEDVLVHEFDERLLREVLGAEGLPVDEMRTQWIGLNLCSVL